jgi:hypothetical protein
MDIEDILIENIMIGLKEIIIGEIFNKSIKIYFYFNYYSNNNHPYHSLRSRHHHHNNNKDYSSNRIGNSYTDHRFDRQTNDDRDIYSTLLIDQPILSPPPPTDLYYSSSQSTRDRSYIDSERTRYSSNYR